MEPRNYLGHREGFVIAQPVLQNRHLQRLTSTRPSVVILDVSWIDYHCDYGNWFYKKFPPRDIIETIASVAILEDYDPIFWSEVESRFDDDEIQSIDLFTVEIIVQSLVEYFYNQLECYVPNAPIEGYVFDCWLDKNSILMVKKKHNF